MPIVLAAIDFLTKIAKIERTFEPVGDVDTDMRAIKEYYRPVKGKYPEKFCADE